MADAQQSDADNDRRSGRYVPRHLQPLMQGIQELFVSKKDIDLLITCHGRHFAVHRAILRTQWPFLDAALNDFNEGEDGVVDLVEDDSAAVAGLIEYFYNFDYKYDDGSSPSMVFDIRMAIIADKYAIQPLSNLVAIKFKKSCKNEWASTEFAHALFVLYVAGEHLDNMKKIALDLIKKHATVLLDESKKEEFARFNEVLEGTALGADVARACMANAGPRGAGKVYWCQNCSYHVTADISFGSTLYCPYNCQGDQTVLVTT